MTITMNDSHLTSISQMEEFLKGNSGIDFVCANRAEGYAWIEKILKQFRYHHLPKRERSIMKKYFMKMTGYSRAQITRIIAPSQTKMKRAKQKEEKRSGKEKEGSGGGKPYRFPVKYGTVAVALLMETDEAHGRLSGRATKKILEREYDFGHREYEGIRNISPAHIYNLRGTRQYVSKLGTVTKTNPTPIPIGER